MIQHRPRDIHLLCRVHRRDSKFSVIIAHLLTPDKLTLVSPRYQETAELRYQDGRQLQVVQSTAKLVLDVLFGEERELSRLGGLPRTKTSQGDFFAAMA
jgi:hypothetical protein